MKTLRIIATVAFLGIPLGVAHALPVISYEAHNLTDTSPGQDLWEVQYHLAGSLGAFEGFNILFGETLYTAVEDPDPPMSGDWATYVIQPSPGDGVFSATALTGMPSLADAVSLRFVWLGAGPPGSQSFEVFNDSFQIIDAGTTLAVPEPGAFWLIAAGIGVIALRRFDPPTR
jgi:hypothetical protein